MSERNMQTQALRPQIDFAATNLLRNFVAAMKVDFVAAMKVVVAIKVDFVATIKFNFVAAIIVYESCFCGCRIG